LHVMPTRKGIRSSFICGAFTRSTNFVRPRREPPEFPRGFAAYVVMDNARELPAERGAANAGADATATRALSVLAGVARETRHFAFTAATRPVTVAEVTHDMSRADAPGGYSRKM